MSDRGASGFFSAVVRDARWRADAATPLAPFSPHAPLAPFETSAGGVQGPHPPALSARAVPAVRRPEPVPASPFGLLSRPPIALPREEPAPATHAERLAPRGMETEGPAPANETAEATTEATAETTMVVAVQGVDANPSPSPKVGEGLAPSRVGGKVLLTPPTPPPSREGASPSPTLGLAPLEAQGEPAGIAAAPPTHSMETASEATPETPRIGTDSPAGPAGRAGRLAARGTETAGATAETTRVVAVQGMGANSSPSPIVGEGLAPSRGGGKVLLTPPAPPPAQEGASPSPTLGLTPLEVRGAREAPAVAMPQSQPIVAAAARQPLASRALPTARVLPAAHVLPAGGGRTGVVPPGERPQAERRREMGGETRKAGETAREPAGAPRVQIGVVEIVVAAPAEPATPARAARPAPAAPNLASRRYLRRL